MTRTAGRNALRPPVLLRKDRKGTSAGITLHCGCSASRRDFVPYGELRSRLSLRIPNSYSGILLFYGADTRIFSWGSVRSERLGGKAPIPMRPQTHRRVQGVPPCTPCLVGGGGLLALGLADILQHLFKPWQFRVERLATLDARELDGAEKVALVLVVTDDA